MDVIKTSSTTTFSDYSIYADTDAQGVLKVLQGREAVENALRMWLVSFPGEVIRMPRKGGYVTKWLFKPMNEDTQQYIKEAIIEGINEDFPIALRLREVEVIPQYDRSEWEINITAYIPAMKVEMNLNESMRALG